jgi:menaquinone-dependent protoporphyrinogen IX oxidase
MDTAKTLIVYKTKYGSTEEYAKWLAEDLGIQKINVEEIDLNKLGNYSNIILMSCTYMTQIKIAGFLKENWDRLKAKDLLLVAVGMVPADSQASRQSFEQLPEEMQKKMDCIKIPGRIGKEKLNFFEKLILKLKSGEGDPDQVKKEHLEQVKDYINKNF